MLYKLGYGRAGPITRGNGLHLGVLLVLRPRPHGDGGSVDDWEQTLSRPHSSGSA